MVDGGEEDERRNGDVSGDEGEGFCGRGRHRRVVEVGGHSVGVSYEGSAINFMRERRRRGRKWEFDVVVDDVWLHVRTLEAAFVLELSSRLGQAGGHKRLSLVENEVTCTFFVLSHSFQALSHTPQQ